MEINESNQEKNMNIFLMITNNLQLFMSYINRKWLSVFYSKNITFTTPPRSRLDRKVFCPVLKLHSPEAILLQENDFIFKT